MEKKKLNALYVLLGVMAIIFVNYPIVELLQGKRWFGFPAMLAYLFVVVVLICFAAFLIARFNENED